MFTTIEAATFTHCTFGAFVAHGGTVGTASVINLTPTSGRIGGRFTEAVLLEREMREICINTEIMQRVEKIYHFLEVYCLSYILELLFELNYIDFQSLISDIDAPFVAQASNIAVRNRDETVNADQIGPLHSPVAILELPEEELSEYKELQLTEPPYQFNPSCCNLSSQILRT